jgi:hypothetical protein
LGLGIGRKAEHDARPIKRKDGNPMTRKLRKMQVAERYGNLNTRTIDRWLTYPELKLS